MLKHKIDKRKIAFKEISNLFSSTAGINISIDGGKRKTTVCLGGGWQFNRYFSVKI